MTPGDRVTFDLTPYLGETNVKIKLRFSIITDSNNLDLVKALSFKIQEGSGTPESYTSYVFSVEAVQGNAYTTGTKDVQIIN